MDPDTKGESNDKQSVENEVNELKRRVRGINFICVRLQLNLREQCANTLYRRYFQQARVQIVQILTLF